MKVLRKLALGTNTSKLAATDTTYPCYPSSDWSRNVAYVAYRYTMIVVQNPLRGHERAKAFGQKHPPRLPRIQSTPARSEVFLGPPSNSNMYFVSYSGAAAAASQASIGMSHEVNPTRFFSRFPRAFPRRDF